MMWQPRCQPHRANANGNTALTQSGHPGDRSTIRIHRELTEALPGYVAVLHNLGVVRRRKRDFAGAGALLERAVVVVVGRELLPETKPELAASLYELGQVRLQEPRASEAEGALRESLELRTSICEPGHPTALATRLALTEALIMLERLDEAESPIPIRAPLRGNEPGEVGR